MVRSSTAARCRSAKPAPAKTVGPVDHAPAGRQVQDRAGSVHARRRGSVRDRSIRAARRRRRHGVEILAPMPNPNAGVRRSRSAKTRSRAGRSRSRAAPARIRSTMIRRKKHYRILTISRRASLKAKRRMRKASRWLFVVGRCRKARKSAQSCRRRQRARRGRVFSCRLSADLSSAAPTS